MLFCNMRKANSGCYRVGFSAEQGCISLGYNPVPDVPANTFSPIADKQKKKAGFKSCKLSTSQGC